MPDESVLCGRYLITVADYTRSDSRGIVLNHRKNKGLANSVHGTKGHIHQIQL